MCEILSLGFLDAVLSLVIFVMNIIYVVWGWFIPDDPNREEFSQHMEKLKSYLNFVTYSDSLALPVKILIMILIQYFVCRKKNNEQTNDSSNDTVNDNSNSSKFHLPNLFNFNVIPQRKKNIVEV